VSKQDHKDAHETDDQCNVIPGFKVIHFSGVLIVAFFAANKPVIRCRAGSLARAKSGPEGNGCKSRACFYFLFPGYHACKRCRQVLAGNYLVL